LKQLELYEANPHLFSPDESNSGSYTKPKATVYYVYGKNIAIEEVTELAGKPMSEEQKLVLEQREAYSKQLLEHIKKPECRVNYNFSIFY
jgi:hypothetical protein